MAQPSHGQFGYFGRLRVLAAVLAGFGRTISEVGAVLIVGGSICGLHANYDDGDRAEDERGELGLALGIGVVLIGISIGVSVGAFALWER